MILQTHLTVHGVSDSTHWHRTPHLCCCPVEGFLLICSFWKDTDWNWIRHFDLQEKKNICRSTLRYSKQTLPIYYMTQVFPWLFVKVKILSILLVCLCCNGINFILKVRHLCLLYACLQPKKILDVLTEAKIEKFTIKLSYHSYSTSDLSTQEASRVWVCVLVRVHKCVVVCVCVVLWNTDSLW